MYEKKPWMRFFYGKQFYLLSKHIDNKLYSINQNKDINLIIQNKVFSLINYLSDLKVNSMKEES